MSYRFFEHTADLGIEVTAPSLDHLLIDCWRALTDSVTSIERIESLETRRFVVEADDLQRLIVDWLSEAIYLFETEGLVFSEVAVRVEQSAAGWRVQATASGEPFELQRHGLKTLVKAATYHGIQIGETAQGWQARLILDL